MQRWLECFFFQAEDGIRDKLVTGVQTCALPIYLPLIEGKLAVRGVFYSDRRGGYIDNVPTAFTRNPNVDRGPSAYSSSYPARLDTYYNYSLVKRAQNPVTYTGMRLAGLYQINDDWNALIQES